MFRWQRFHLVFAVYGLLVSISAFITAYTLFLIPADPRNILFLGFSPQRLIMLVSVTLAGILSAVFVIKAYHDKPWSERMWFSLFGRKSLAKGIRWGAAAGLISGMVVSFMPLYRFGDFQDYFIRISPLAVWLTFVSWLTFVVLWIEKYGIHWSYLLDTLHAQKKILNIVLISLSAFAIIWIFIAKTGMGLWVSDGYWYGAGVPILGLQVLLGFAIGIGVFFLERSSLKAYFPTWLDLFIFFLLWGITAFLWAREPLRPSYFAPGPYPPDQTYHPYSDAAIFDMGSQFALIGQGIYNRVFFDRALYMAFLAFLHALVGQDYTQVVTLQAAIYGIFPAILYLLGKAIHSRSFGSTIAVLAMLRGINGIAASSMINLVNQKQMLTDFPTVIFVAWFTLMMVWWSKDPAKNYLYALWAGGVAGLAIMLRTNALFLVIFALLMVVIVYWRQKLRGMLIGFLLVVTMFAATFAWGAYNDNSIFDVYLYRIRVVIEARYPKPATPVPAPQPATPISNLQESESSSYDESNTAAPIQLDTISQPLVNDETGNNQIKPIPVFVTIHFLHNLITSVFILPTTFEFHDLRHTLKAGAPFWESYWDGNLAFNEVFFVILNLFLISFGIGVGWKFARFSGIVPLGVFLFYNLANAFARTSGGRYLVPTDWIVLFYFALGLFQITLWGMVLFGFKDNRGMENISMVPNDTDGTSWIWKSLSRLHASYSSFFLSAHQYRYLSNFSQDGIRSKPRPNCSRF